MITLSNLNNPTLKRKKKKRVGRGIGSGLGKTCGRGEKGAGARSGYKRRHGYEGGQMRLFMKLPTRGFSNARFSRPLHTINLADIERAFDEGDAVNLETLAMRGFISGTTYGVKLLGNGTLTKKVTIEVDEISQGAREKLELAKIEFTVLE
ncbi:50S ribosomal protein L15 [Chlamydiales bacterium STE3]|uniref:Large ribosomal subunit protein uL15 n=1 Tax=Chlamydiales bacterium STE3 TaxID=1910938 RepID=A0A1K0K0V5_9CHLA|nr:50S ribosomal protein L15 [Chlamydiales bacterium STE3]SDA08619.1 50S ribosomal protein L15 [Chlamydiales bacterium STE3]